MAILLLLVIRFVGLALLRAPRPPREGGGA